MFFVDHHVVLMLVREEEEGEHSFLNTDRTDDLQRERKQVMKSR